MPTLPLPRHAFAGGPADGFVGDKGRMSRPALIVSVLAHIAVLYAASQWYPAEPAPVAIMFEWLTVLEAPSEPAVQPPSEVVEPPAPPIAPASPLRLRTEAPRAVSPPDVAPPQAEAPAEPPPAPPVGPSRFDIDAARRTAAAAVVEQRARDGAIRPPSIFDAPPAPPPRTSVPKKPSIFDYQPSPPRGVLQPGKQRSVLGQRLSLWCAKATGGGFRLGLGFFSVPACVSQGIQPPSGIFADSIPEYMKLKPECEETQPLAATLGENGPFPTMKCRLVPKEPNE